MYNLYYKDKNMLVYLLRCSPDYYLAMCRGGVPFFRLYLVFSGVPIILNPSDIQYFTKCTNYLYGDVQQWS